MCLGIPMEVVSVDRWVARCSAKGVEREVSLLLLGEASVAPGEFVQVHLGQAIEVMTREQAEAAWALYDEILAYTPPDASADTGTSG